MYNLVIGVEEGRALASAQGRDLITKGHKKVALSSPRKGQDEGQSNNSIRELRFVVISNEIGGGHYNTEAWVYV